MKEKSRWEIVKSGFFAGIGIAVAFSITNFVVGMIVSFLLYR